MARIVMGILLFLGYAIRGSAPFGVKDDVLYVAAWLTTAVMLQFVFGD